MLPAVCLQMLHAEMHGARPRCYEDTDMACLLQHIDFNTFTDIEGRLQAVVDLDGDAEDPYSHSAGAAVAERYKVRFHLSATCRIIHASVSERSRGSVRLVAV